MHAQAMWREFSDGMRAKFDGQLGQMAYREAVSLMVMGITHKIILKNLEPRYHAAVNAGWYGSLAPGHPLHALRSAAQRFAADFAVRADEIFGSPLQHKFHVIDTTAVPAVERFIDRNAAHLDRLVDSLHRRA